ncbi:putative alpha-L-fucosidase [Hyposmocoma kahamanoa]|uniref:putative alpha-L-fucosidase n=1 Tax=Hyposmocoma kahamanoa TaxID=1477025 RepID=UPI000E6D6D9F|nr:putative alpha-L-fucosidase [Hyposmocoma kahamanoa]
MVLRVFAENRPYASKWEHLDSRPLPLWYDVGKIGIFIHWGLYSVPAKGEWLWSMLDNGNTDMIDFMKNNYSSDFQYENFASLFKAESFEPDFWAELFSKAGAKYVVFTTKHHEGFALFPSKSGAPGWNSVETGPKKDIVNELSQSIRKYNMKFGAYYSLLEWHNEMYLKDKDELFLNTTYVDKLVWKDIKQLIRDYKPSVLWLDGEWEACCRYWKATELLTWLYNKSPVKDEIVVNDRWCKTSRCGHGDFYTCDDRYNPHALMFHKWENAFTLDRYSWGYRSDMTIADVLSIEELIENVVSTVSCGGNVLINVGPTKEGIIVPIFQERLLQLGEWLLINGEAIYNTSAWFYQRDTLNLDVWYTCKKERYDTFRLSNIPNKNDSIVAIYAIFLKWPVDDILSVKDLSSYISKNEFDQISLLLPDKHISLNYTIMNNSVVAVRLPSNASNYFGWVLKIDD